MNEEIFLLKKKMELLWNQQQGQCLRVYSKLKEMETFSEIRKFAARYNESFILVGWFPAEKEREFGNKLSEVNGVEYSTETGRNILGHFICICILCISVSVYIYNICYILYMEYNMSHVMCQCHLLYTTYYIIYTNYILYVSVSLCV